MESSSRSASLVCLHHPCLFRSSAYQLYPGEFTVKNLAQDLPRLLKAAPAQESSADATVIIRKPRNVFANLLKSIMLLTAELSLPTAPAALSALILYLGLMGNSENFGAYTLQSHDLSQYMKLDASALKALNLVDTSAHTVSPQFYRKATLSYPFSGAK